MTNEMSMHEAKENFVELINHVAHVKERIILTKRGKSIAAIVPLEDLEFLTSLQDKSDLNAAIEALKEARSKGAKTLEEVKEAIGI